MQASTRYVLSREDREGRQFSSNDEKLFGIRLIGLMQKADLSKFFSPQPSVCLSRKWANYSITYYFRNKEYKMLST